jgi:hypothetical protein
MTTSRTARRPVAEAESHTAVLDRDILALGASAGIGARVALTVVGGEIVHQTEDVA